MFSQKEFLRFTKGAMLNLAIVVLAVLVFPLTPAGGSNAALAQERQSTMETRIDDQFRQLKAVTGCPAETATIQTMFDALLANFAPATEETSVILGEAIARASDQLTNYAQQAGRCSEAQGM